MKRRLLLAAGACTLTVFGLIACGDDDDNPVAPKPDASAADSSAADNYVPPTDASATDANTSTDAGPPKPVVFKSFNATNGENPGGLALVAGKGLLVTMAKTGNIMAIQDDGGTNPTAATVAGFGATPLTSTVWLLGVAADTAGDLYATVSVQGPPPWNPAPGVYKIPAAGGAATMFATHAAMKSPNSLMFLGTDLLISDTGGRIFKADPTGTTTIWSADTALAGRADGGTGNCPIPIPAAIGSAGMTQDANNVYVVNVDFGSLYKIPVTAGAAGTPVLIKKDCEKLGGADGVVIDKDGSFLVGVAVKNAVQRVTPAGDITTLLTGAPLDGPAKMVIESSGGKRRLLIGNNAFGTSQTMIATAKPSIVSLELAP